MRFIGDVRVSRYAPGSLIRPLREQLDHTSADTHEATRLKLRQCLQALLRDSKIRTLYGSGRRKPADESKIRPIFGHPRPSQGCPLTRSLCPITGILYATTQPDSAPFTALKPSIHHSPHKKSRPRYSPEAAPFKSANSLCRADRVWQPISARRCRPATTARCQCAVLRKRNRRATQQAVLMHGAACVGNVSDHSEKNGGVTSPAHPCRATSSSAPGRHTPSHTARPPPTAPESLPACRFSCHTSPSAVPGSASRSPSGPAAS